MTSRQLATRPEPADSDAAGRNRRGFRYYVVHLDATLAELRDQY